MWNFHSINQALQNENDDLKMCTDLYELWIGIIHLYGKQLYILWDEFQRYETAAKEMLTDVDYKTATTRKHMRKKLPNNWDAPDVYLNARDK